MSDDVATAFDIIVAAEEKTARRSMLAGQEFTLVDEPKAGALLILMRRLDDKNNQTKLAAVVRLLEKWIVPDEHERLFEAIEDIDDIQVWMETDLAKFIEMATTRPT